MLAVYFDGARFGVQAVAVAALARRAGLVFFKRFTFAVAFGFHHPAFHIADDAFKRLVRPVGVGAVFIGDRDRRVAGTVQDCLLDVLRQFFKGCIRCFIIKIKNLLKSL